MMTRKPHSQETRGRQSWQSSVVCAARPVYRAILVSSSLLTSNLRSETLDPATGTNGGLYR